MGQFPPPADPFSPSPAAPAPPRGGGGSSVRTRWRRRPMIAVNGVPVLADALVVVLALLLTRPG
ncbi:hypothetical protein ACIOMM_15595 [Streptomyces sp. NPDC087908]|uniref:hypothetical protein n=1 Tax=Streptomyces sp. NPDC087908 TaxID=3365820 RepID=UPI00380DCAA0